MLKNQSHAGHNYLYLEANAYMKEWRGVVTFFFSLKNEQLTESLLTVIISDKGFSQYVS